VAARIVNAACKVHTQSASAARLHITNFANTFHNDIFFQGQYSRSFNPCNGGKDLRVQQWWAARFRKSHTAVVHGGGNLI
jgi:hypothetical protein